MKILARQPGIKAAAAIFFILCGNGIFAQNPDNYTIIKPKEIDDVLINPGIGFNTFQMFNGDNLAPNQDVLREVNVGQFRHTGNEPEK